MARGNTPYYSGDPISPITDRLTLEQKLDLMDWHPIFTGRCPNCETPMLETQPPRVHWDCSECSWVDDTV